MEHFHKNADFDCCHFFRSISNFPASFCSLVELSADSESQKLPSQSLSNLAHLSLVCLKHSTWDWLKPNSATLFQEHDFTFSRENRPGNEVAQKPIAPPPPRNVLSHPTKSLLEEKSGKLPLDLASYEK